jgi:hypothetical protein
MSNHRAREAPATVPERVGWAAATAGAVALLVWMLWPQPTPEPPLPLSAVQAVVPPPPTATVPLPWPEPASRITLGRAVVGRDLVPGEYRTAGGQACWWTRDPGTEWETTGRSDGPVAVVLRDQATFATDGCGPWELR